MRVMVIVKATKDSEAGKMPSEEMLAAMAKFNEEMVKAGIMLDGAGLRPSSQGAPASIQSRSDAAISSASSRTRRRRGSSSRAGTTFRC